LDHESFQMLFDMRAGKVARVFPVGSNFRSHQEVPSTRESIHRTSGTSQQVRQEDQIVGSARAVFAGQVATDADALKQ
jgi:hypothetical protein